MVHCKVIRPGYAMDGFAHALSRTSTNGASPGGIVRLISPAVVGAVHEETNTPPTYTLNGIGGVASDTNDILIVVRSIGAIV